MHSAINIAFPDEASGIAESSGEQGLVRTDSVLGGVLKEIARRVELRQRLETEKGEPISDEEFLVIAECSGGVRL